MTNSHFCFPGLITVLAVIGAAHAPAFAQTSGENAPEITFCDPALSRDINAEWDEDEDDNDFSTRRLYDQETARQITDPDAIANALFEERWNLQTGQINPRYELCQSRPSYVVHWAQVFSRDEDGNVLLDAEGLLSFQRDGGLEFVYADRAYRGTWELDGAEIVITTPWIDGGKPRRAVLELVQTPVEITYGDSRTDTFTEENLRLGWFRLLRIATAERGKVRKCECGEP